MPDAQNFPPRHPRELPPAWPKPEDMKTMKGDEPSFDWAMLVPHIVHPVKVAIVEALLHMGRPLSASELSKLFDEPKDNYLSVISYHVRGLAKAGALVEAGSRQVRGAKETFYFFPAPPSNGKVAP